MAEEVEYAYMSTIEALEVSSRPLGNGIGKNSVINRIQKPRAPHKKHGGFRRPFEDFGLQQHLVRQRVKVFSIYPSKDLKPADNQRENDEEFDESGIH